MTGTSPLQADNGFLPVEAALERLDTLLSEACRIADAAKLDLAAIKIEEARYIAREHLRAGGTNYTSDSDISLN